MSNTMQSSAEINSQVTSVELNDQELAEVVGAFGGCCEIVADDCCFGEHLHHGHLFHHHHRQFHHFHNSDPCCDPCCNPCCF